MNWRAAGCLVAGVATFLAITLLGLSLSIGRGDGCPAQLQWAERVYLPVGSPGPVASFAESGAPVKLGSTFIGLSTRAVYGPPGSSPSELAADRPSEIAMDCADGTFQGYRYSSDLPAASP
jgi:hypothetical protein